MPGRTTKRAKSLKKFQIKAGCLMETTVGAASNNAVDDAGDEDKAVEK